MEWATFLEDMHGELYYCINGAYMSGRPWADHLAAGGNGDGSMLYPGTPTEIGGVHHIPVVSMRLKHVRDGMEDYEYLRALEAASGGREAPLALLAEFMQAPSRFDNSAAALLSTRAKIGAAIDKLAAQRRA